MNDVIGGNIARLRKERNMTQEQLANLMGISYQAVSKWETGISSPDVSSLPLLADTFGVMIDALFGRGEAEPRPEKANYPWPDDDCIYAVLYHGHQFIGASDSSEKKRIEICYAGAALNIKSDFSVYVNGEVDGDIEAGGSVTCDDVGGDIDSGGNVTCDDVKGNVRAGGSVTCDNVGGNVTAGANATCDNVSGNVSAGMHVEHGKSVIHLDY